MLPPFQITGFRFARSDDSSKQLSASSGWTDIYLAYPSEYDEVIDGAPQARLTYVDEESDKILVGSSTELVSRLEELIPDPSSPPPFPIVFQIAKPEGLQVWFVYLDRKKSIPQPLSLACAPKAVKEKIASPTSNSSFFEAFERDLKEALENASPISSAQDKNEDNARSSDTSSQSSTSQQNVMNSDAVVQLLLGGMVNTLNDALAPLYPGFRNLIPQIQQNDNLKNAAEILQSIGRVAESALQNTNQGEVIEHVTANVQETISSVNSVLGSTLGDVSPHSTAYGNFGGSLFDTLRSDPDKTSQLHTVVGSPDNEDENPEEEPWVPSTEKETAATSLAARTCKYCPVVLSSRLDMDRHIKDEHGDHTSKCNCCGLTFNCQQRYQNHLVECPMFRAEASESVSSNVSRPGSVNSPVELETTEILEAGSNDGGPLKELSTAVYHTPVVIDAEYPEAGIDMIAFEEALTISQNDRPLTVEECNNAREVADLEKDDSDNNKTAFKEISLPPAPQPPSTHHNPGERTSVLYPPPPKEVPLASSSVRSNSSFASGPSSQAESSQFLPPFRSPQRFRRTNDPFMGAKNPVSSSSPPSRPPPPPPPPPRGLRKTMSMNIGEGRPTLLNVGEGRSGFESSQANPPCWGVFQTAPLDIRRHSTVPTACIKEPNFPLQYRYNGQGQPSQQQEKQQNKQSNLHLESPEQPRRTWQWLEHGQGGPSGLSHRHSVRILRSNNVTEQTEFDPRFDRMKKTASMCKMQMKYREDGIENGEGRGNPGSRRPRRLPTRARWSSYISATPATGDKEHEQQLYAGLEQLEQREREREAQQASLSNGPPVRPPRPEYSIIPDIAEDTSDADTVPLLSRRSSPDNDGTISVGLSDELKKGFSSPFRDPEPPRRRQQQLRPQQSQPNMTQIGHGSSNQVPMMIGMGRDPSFRRPYPRALPTPPVRQQPSHVNYINLFDEAPAHPGPPHSFSHRPTFNGLDDLFPLQSHPAPSPSKPTTVNLFDTESQPPNLTQRENSLALGSLFLDKTKEDRQINRCVNSLIEMGYGADEEGVENFDVDRLTAVANMAGGDVDTAILILEEDREAKRLLRGKAKVEGRKWNPYR